MSQSVARALSLLDRVANGTATLGELAAAEGVHKSTVLRLLRVLEDEGFVHHDGEHRYVLGPHLFRLAQQALDSFDVRVVAMPRLKALRDEIGQTVHLAILDGSVAVYVDKLEPREMPVRMASRIGKTAALHSTAVGKVLLAGLDPAERGELIADLTYPRFTDRTPAGPAELIIEVDTAAAHGWAEDHAENETFINCVGAPIRGADGRTLAAVSISVPDVLLPYEGVLDLVPALLTATTDISRECGYRD
ncbi:IclR family transcriptional regulator [Cryptosporangium phraense]|uniref:IclR family transcriptional regulator n=1 Tax=Cryptosporangium phraense TaxID=2593070 RepID=A0A545AZT4_9ACTN|nr:IclR family transcriptional regulator [Cryptosporangium phraense]TQS46824.1 IclR family transcriptional regulator [Cryptosporangium phraense]